jgi:2'-5' RNA ligase
MSKSFFTLIFDDDLEQHVRRFGQVLAKAGIDGPPEERHRPHVTLAGFDLADAACCAGPLQQLCSRRKPMPIRLHHIGVFPERGVLFLQPRMTRGLMALHRAIIEEVAPALGKSPTSANFAIDYWTPHCTLAEAVPDGLLGKAVDLLQQHWRSVEGNAIGIGVLVPPATVDCLQFTLGGPAGAE